MSLDKVDGPIYLSRPFIPTIAPQNSTLLLSKKKGVSILRQLFCFALMSSPFVQVSFQLPKSTLLTFRHLGCACIYFLQLHVLHVLRYDGDPMVEDFMGTWVGILPLAFPSHIYIYMWPEDFDCFTFCIFKS